MVTNNQQVRPSGAIIAPIPAPRPAFRSNITPTETAPLPRVRPTDVAKVGSAQGTAQASFSLGIAEGPAWTQNQKDTIVAGFRAGLHQYGITIEQVNEVLKRNGMGDLQITEDSIQDPANAEKIKQIQTMLDKKLNNPTLKSLGQANAVGIDGQFGKGSVAAVAALRDAYRGEPVELPITPIKQETRTGCYRASEAMTYNVIHGKDGTSDAYTEFDARDRIRGGDMEKTEIYVASKENGSGRVTVNKANSQKMLNALDAELDARHPVIAGVSYRKQDGKEYNEGVTDHFITISGRGQDDVGSFYTFQDSAQGNTHKLYLDPVTGRLSGKGDMLGTYDVTLIHTAAVTDAETVERYKKMGKVLHSQGQSNSGIARIQKQLTALGYDTKGTSGGYGPGTSSAVKAFQQAHQLPLAGSSIDTHTRDAINAAYLEHQRSHPTDIMFKRGESSADLSPVQKALTKLGFNTKGTNGQFGPGTEAAVKAFQSQNGIEPSGKIDNQTFFKIMELAAAQG
jgi:peptidoglycan hydrolase-like protein with peptidoglycan-binding domain